MMMKCPACGSRVEDAHGINHQGRLWMYQCPSCAFAFVYPPPSFTGTAEVYEDAYTAHPAAEWKSKKQALAYLSKIRAFVPDRCAFLEIGGSHGWFAELVQKTTQADVTMVEPGRTAVKAATGRGLHAVCAFLHQFKSERRYDVIFSAHVVEHVPDIDAFLCQCHALLEGEGKIILLTPNAGAWKFRWRKAEWGWAAAGSHLHLLTRKSAQIFLERNGFTVETIQVLRTGRVNYPVVLTKLLSEWYSRLFVGAKATVQTPLPSGVGAPAVAGTKPSRVKSLLIDCVRKVGRPILWAEYALLNLIDIVLGGESADELLIVGRRKL